MHSFYLVSLGCAKNLVDSELVIGNMTAAGWSLAAEPEAADVVMVNTCGFIQPAVEEAIDEILALGQLKADHPGQKLVVIGCMVQRYGASLASELPEVDLFVGTEGWADMGQRIESLISPGGVTDSVHLPDRLLMDSRQPRVLATPFFRAWLKITEGCDNRCSYCMIPSIRGQLRSRPMTDLVMEASRLERLGVQELSFIAQDLTAYGDDLPSGSNLVALLRSVLRETAIPWLRLLYLYPSSVDEELLALMAEQPRIVPYLDIPVQHASSTVLARMGRRYTNDDLYRVVAQIRRYLPEVALRTSLLVGFPGETDKDVEELVRFVRDVRFDHLGVFPYANEEGSVSMHFPGQIGPEEKLARRDRILEVQAQISQEICRKYLGRREQVLVEGLSEETDLLLEGRTRFQAPDVDGCVYINDGIARPGELVTVLIEESQVYDLVGGIVENDQR
ncbi:MAG: 30S ribosomal protein S12 methylthiotransferase RimO [Desulfopila sp.]